jgi:hypothetical protein
MALYIYSEFDEYWYNPDKNLFIINVILNLWNILIYVIILCNIMRNINFNMRCVGDPIINKTKHEITVIPENRPWDIILNIFQWTVQKCLRLNYSAHILWWRMNGLVILTICVVISLSVYQLRGIRGNSCNGISIIIIVYGSLSWGN